MSILILCRFIDMCQFIFQKCQIFECIFNDFLHFFQFLDFSFILLKRNKKWCIFLKKKFNFFLPHWDVFAPQIIPCNLPWCAKKYITGVFHNEVTIVEMKSCCKCFKNGPEGNSWLSATCKLRISLRLYSDYLLYRETQF